MQQKRKVGFIGLGDIGRPMAARLVGEAFEVWVFDVVQAAVDELREAGARAGESPAALAASCSYIGICVRDDAQVESVLRGEEGILAHAAPGSVVAIHSTVTRASLLAWEQEAAAAGVTLVDAPITGGAARAGEGTLCYMVGGSDEVLADITPILQTSAEKIVHAGPLGAGIALKLCNNYIQYAEFVAMAEAARLAEACGLSLAVIREVGLSNGVVNAQMHQFITGRNGLAAAGSAGQMQEFFGAHAALARKDMDCTLSTAAEQGVRMPAAEFVRDRIEDVFLARDESRPPAPKE